MERLQSMMTVRQTSVFMHDGAPCHQAKLVKEWLTAKKIEVLGPWPGNSPDLNPIDNLWYILKREVAKHHPTSLEDLKQIIRQVWCREITQEFSKKLVNSMPKRLQEVIKNNGYHIKY